MRKLEKEECYKLLSVGEKASREEIQKAFVLAMQKFRKKERLQPLQTGEKRELERLLSAYKSLIQEKDSSSESIQKLGEMKNGEKSFTKGAISNGFENQNERRFEKTRNVKSVSTFEDFNSNLVAIREPKSLASEQYRVLFSKVCHVFKEESNKVITVSSAVKGEGKTVTSINLSYVIARDFNHKTLLIDGDLKKPDLLSYLGLKNRKGLVDVLLEKADLKECLISGIFENLSFLPAGGRFETSSRLLKMGKMKELLYKMSEEFEFVIIDSPPVLSLADMNIFSSLVDGILFVVRAGKTPRNLVQKAIRNLPEEKILGIVLNDMEQSFSMGYGYPY